MKGTVDELRALLAHSRRIVAFTGAGVSVDSGIPDFRSPGGVWQSIDPSTLSRWTFDAGPSGRAAFWHAVQALIPVDAVAPNPVHYALARLEASGRMLGVVTQNVDGLHQAAGSRKVVELHGHLRTCHCVDCMDRVPWERAAAQLRAGARVPLCDQCEGPLRPDVVAFGDPMPTLAVDKAWRWAEQADLCLVLGSSLAVHPAAELPVAARRAGARLAIVTLSDTPIDTLADVRLWAPLQEGFVPAVP